MASSSSSGALGNGFGFGFGGENNNPFNHGGQKRTHSEEDILALLEGLEPGAKRRLQQRLGVTQEAENGGAVGSSEGGNVELPANPYVPQGNEYVEEEQGEEVEEEPVGEGDHHAPTATQVEVEVESEEAVSVAPASTPVIYLLQQPAQVAQPKSVAPATAVPMAKTTMAAKTATMSGKQGDEARDNCPLWKALDTMWEKRTNPGVEHFEQAQSFLRGLRNFSRLSNAPYGDNHDFMKLYWDELTEERVNMLRDRYIVSNYDLENTHNKGVAGKEWREYHIGQKSGFSRFYFKSKFVANETQFLRDIPERDRRNVCSCINMVLIDNRKFFTPDHKDRCHAALERMCCSWKELVYRVARTIIKQPKAMVQAAYFQADWF